MAQAGYKQLISYNLALIAFELGWDFVPRYYRKIEDSRQRDQIKQARRPARQLCSTSRVRIVLKRLVVNLGGSHKQNIVEGSSERSLSSKLKLYDVAKASGMEALEGLEGKEGLEATVNYFVDLLTRSGFLLDRQINAVEKKHQREGGYNEKLLKKRLEYRKSF